MGYKTCFALVFMLSVVRCNQCSDEDLKTLFNSDSHLCNEEGSWSFSKASADIVKNKEISNVLTPSTVSSCITSKALPLDNGGTLRINVYAEAITNEDYLSVLVYDTKDNVIGQTSLSEEENAVNDGWHDLVLHLGGVGHYDGYIQLVGQSSSDSNILVESICYTPAHEEKLLSEDISKSDNYQTPDIYSLQTGSALLYKIQTNENRKSEMELDAVQESRSFWIFDREDFWTPLTISLAVLIPLLIIILLGLVCFALGKKSARKESIVFEDLENLPKPYVVPRVKNVYAESVTSSIYGRNNNMYSA